jgi:outer membrane protein OmpA-like peptidoglycan-associated protein
MTHCTTCGNQLAPGARFCPKCGAAVDAPGQPVAEAPSVAPLVPPPQAYAPPQKRSGLPVVLIILAFLGLIVVAGVGGVVYIGYQVKQKVTSVAQAVREAAPAVGSPSEAPGPTEASAAKDSAPSQNAPTQIDPSNLGGILGNLSSLLGPEQAGDKVPILRTSDPVTPCAAASLPAQTAPQVPFQAGTIVTTAWGMKNGDVESRSAVTSLDPTSFAEKVSTEAYKDDNGFANPPSSYDVTTCNADVASSESYITVVGRHVPALIHGVTRLRLSSKSFQEAKLSGKTNVIYDDIFPAADDGGQLTSEGGLLTRVEPQDVAYPMIVNDQRVNLPAIHLAGIMDSVGKDPRPKMIRPSHTEVDLYVIDDPVDPVVLLLRLKDPQLHEGKFRIETIKIDYKTTKPENIVEKQLTEQKRAVTYGIYFDFNKDTIKPESEPVLKEIVQAMTDNPDWKLTVEGNTDNIGGDTYNLDLSKRRAAAVKETLVTHYHIAPERLSANGFGASHPIETNDTLEGRARNRRVELTRE